MASPAQTECDSTPPVSPPVRDAPSLRELGSFAHGTCDDCAWTGPARRARQSAHRDLTLHRSATHTEDLGGS